MAANALTVIGYSIVVLLFITGVALAHLATAVLFTILEEVNSRLSEDNRINPYTAAFKMRVFEALSIHRKQYPDSTKRKRMWTLTGAYFALFFVTAVLFYFVSRE